MSMNVKKNATIAALVVLCSALGLVGTSRAANPPANADEVVAHHLDSMATSAIRAGIKTRVAQGPVHYSIVVGGVGPQDGKAQIASDGKKVVFMIKLPNNQYRGEQFIFDGDKDRIAFSTAQQTRSPFGNFVFVQDVVIREGLLGGVLTTAWPLANLNDRKAKVSFDGLKKIDGQELYDLRYRPHKSTDVEIHLYFDPQTYRHVETIYSLTISESIAGGNLIPGAGSGTPTAGSPDSAGTNPGVSRETLQARQTPNRYRLQEKFSDFKTVDGVTLPTRDDIQFSVEPQSGKNWVYEWDLKDLEIGNNVPVDARNFEIK